jgi:hypothetical protein
MVTKEAEGIVRYQLSTNHLEGKAAKRAKKYQVYFSQEALQEGPEFIGWWIMVPKMTTAEEVLIEEVKGVLMAHLDPVGTATGAAGGAAAATHKIYKTAEDVAKAKSFVGGGMASKITKRFSRAWAAGTWSAAKGTRQEFAIAAGEAICGGALWIIQGPSELTGSIRVYSKEDTFKFMGYGGGSSDHCKEIAEAGTTFTM